MLESIKLDRRHDAGETADAAWILGRWYLSREQPRLALDNFLIRRLASPSADSLIMHLILEVAALCKLDQVREAHELVQFGIGVFGDDPDLCYCAVNVCALNDDLSVLESGRAQLVWLNTALVKKGLQPLELKNPSRSLDLDNIVVRSMAPDPRSGDARISVLMPAYNAESTIATAIESILRQTWANLELVVVDDASSDDNWSVIQSFAAMDSRVIPVRHEQNRGTYAARNTALRIASGDFVTVQDADDWSHCERLARQAIDLLDSNHVVNMTRLIRVGPRFELKIHPDGSIVRLNLSSMMTRRQNIFELGGWDECRTGADVELHERLLVKYAAVKHMVSPKVPLCFAAGGTTNITAQQETGSITEHYGARREYIEAFRYWHQLELSKGTPDLRMRPPERRFPIPHLLRTGPHRRLEYDILFVSDFTLPGGTTSSNVNMLRAAKALGLKCACFHWPTLLTAGKDINPKIRGLLHEGIADSVVVFESVACKLVIVNYPPLLNHFPDMRLEVQTDACVLIVNQAPNSRYEEASVIYRVDVVLENARAAFGVDPQLAPISPIIRRILRETTNYENFTALDWTPLTDWTRRRTSSWDASRLPIVGRHSRDHEDKWPSDAAALRAAYCADMPVRVRILGGAEVAKLILGARPSNWTILPFDSVDVRTFLSELDFFVHYPHEHCIEAFGRSAMEALAVGVPAILPPRLRETFGEGAIYAEPADVYDVVKRLWNDKLEYEAQIQRGLEYISRMCSLARFEDRVRPHVFDKRQPTKEQVSS
jgi:hypothetical protein